MFCVHYIFNNRLQAKISAPTRVHLEKKRVQSSGEVQADDEIKYVGANTYAHI
jgi:hypothetical protein